MNMNKDKKTNIQEKKIYEDKTVEQPNVIKGYDGNGEMTMYYWQKEPIEQRIRTFQPSIPRRLWWNPIWRIRQWWLIRQPVRVYPLDMGVSSTQDSKSNQHTQNTKKKAI